MEGSEHGTPQETEGEQATGHRDGAASAGAGTGEETPRAPAKVIRPAEYALAVMTWTAVFLAAFVAAILIFRPGRDDDGGERDPAPPPPDDPGMTPYTGPPKHEDEVLRVLKTKETT